MANNLPKKLSEINAPKQSKKTPEQKQKAPQAVEPKTVESTETSDVPVITKITAQKRKGRYNIFLDDEYAFAVDEALLVKYLLRKGMEIPKELQKELETEDVSRKAYQRGLTYLNYALRSEKEVRDDLVAHDFEEQADEVIALLKEQRFINDLIYAKSYVRTAFNINRKGPKVIERDLQKKGVSVSNITEALEEYPEEEQVNNAFKLAEKTFNKSKKHSSRETVNKIRLHLMRKGFDAEIIEHVLEEMDTEKDEEEEMAALRKQGKKAWRRYSKFEPFERNQKLKANLYQKGFNGELIQRFINEKEMDEEVE